MTASPSNPRPRQPRRSRFIRLPGFNPDRSCGRSIGAVIGDSQVSVGNADFDELVQKTKRFSQPIRGMASRAGFGQTTYLKLNNGTWYFDPTAIGVDTPGSHKINFSFFHPSFPAPISEDVVLITSMQSDPVSLFYCEENPTLSIYPNGGWVNVFDKIEFIGPLEKLPATTTDSWKDISDYTEIDPYQVVMMNWDDVHKLKYCLIRLEGKSIHPYSIEELAAKARSIVNQGNMIPTLIDIFDIPDDEWEKYMSSIIKIISLKLRRGLGEWEWGDKSAEVILRDKIRDFVNSKAIPYYLKNASTGNCSYCKAINEYRKIGNREMLSLIKQSGDRTWKDIHSDVRFIVPLLMLEPNIPKRPGFMSEEHNFPNFVWAKDGEQKILPRGGFLMHTNWEPIDDNNYLRKLTTGWACGIPLRMEFSYKDWHIIVNWLGVLQYTWRHK